MSPPTGSNHDVSILITAVDVAGRVRDEAPRWNVSMTLTPTCDYSHRDILLGIIVIFGSDARVRLVADFGIS